MYSSTLDFKFAFVQNKKHDARLEGGQCEVIARNRNALRRGPREYRARKAANPAGTHVPPPGGKAFDGREGGCLEERGG